MKAFFLKIVYIFTLVFFVFMLSISVIAAKRGNLSMEPVCNAEHIDEYTIHVDLGEPFCIEFNLISKRWEFDKYTFKEGLKPYTPECNEDECSIYLGEFRTGSNMSAPARSVFMKIMTLDFETTDIAKLKSFCKELSGYNPNYFQDEIDSISITANIHNTRLSRISFPMDGGESYYYFIVHGTPSILINNAHWIDEESIKRSTALGT
jgi:hypothetical protein